MAGFRIDVCNVIIKDALLRDNPAATEDDDFEAQMFGQRSVYNANRPEVHEVIRRWRALADTLRRAAACSSGETPVAGRRVWPAYYGRGSDELHLAFNFPFISAPFEPAAPCGPSSRRPKRPCPPGAWPAWTGSNHDMFRFATRWAGDDPGKARAALLMLLSLRGTPVLYQGDEIGLPDTTVTHEDMRDPLGVRYWPYYDGRDAVRTPMPVERRPRGRFHRSGVRPWLPLGDVDACNVEAQRSDPDSVLLFVARTHRPATSADGRPAHRVLLGAAAPEGVWAWNRGERHFVVAST